MKIYTKKNGEEEEELYCNDGTEVIQAVVVKDPGEPKQEVLSTESGVKYPTNDISNNGDVPSSQEEFFLPL